MARAKNQPSVADTVRALGEAAALASGRSDQTVVDEARRVVRQAGQRLAFSGDNTVVALAGATGSGKSSTFNAVSGTTLAEPGVRRPTTSTAMAATWGSEPPAQLLDWLEVPRRHVVTGGTADLDGLVLLDLPDHDSTELDHRKEVDRLVKLVDMFIWVVDPQKYADAALHDTYLRPLADHAEVMTVVLNQADRLTPEQLRRCLADLRRLLDSEGLGKAQLLAISAVTGQGVDELQARLAAAVRDKQMAARRLAADVRTAAGALSADIGTARVEPVSGAPVKQLERSLAEAAGVHVVTEAVLKATRRRGTLATGWPALSWVARLRPDPLRRLHLDRMIETGRKARQKAIQPVEVSRTTLPSAATGVQKARVDAAIRAVADEAVQGLPRGWADAVRRVSRAEEDSLTDQLDNAVATTDLAMETGHGYWSWIRVLQWLFIAVVLVGLGWLALGVVLLYFQLPALPPALRWHGIGLPTWLVIGGVAAGLLLALISRVFVEITARSKAARAQHVLGKSVAAVAARTVVDPVNKELRRYQEAQATVARAV